MAYFDRMARASYVAAAVAASIVSMTGTAAAANLVVTVLAPSGNPNAGVTVCVGTAANRAQYGVATTGPQGTATFYNLPQPGFHAPGSSPAGTAGPTSLLVTARIGSRYVEQNTTGVLGTASLTLPAANMAGGPLCPTGSAASNGNTQPGQLTFDRARVRQKYDAAAAAQQPFAPVQFTQTPPPQHCFGAAGSQCGIGQDTNVGFCAGNLCQVHGGSWAHDECCYRAWKDGRPHGMGCVNGPADELAMPQTTVCTTEWNLAKSRLVGNWGWTRVVDRDETNATGIVDRAKYCALSGSVVHRDDAQFCCSNSSRAPNGLGDTLALNGRPASLARICN